MTRSFRLALAFCLLASPLAAETLIAESKITKVTVYGYGALVTRQVSLDLPAGVTEVSLPDLTEQFMLNSLQINAPEGVSVVAVSLAKDRLPPLNITPSPAVQAAQDKVDQLEASLRQSADAVAAIRLRAKAATEHVAALRGIAQTSHGTQTTEDLRDMARMVSEETLAALQAARAAEQEADAAERARADEVRALEDAKQALAALKPVREGRKALLMTLNSVSGGPAVLELTGPAEAEWSPIYDLRLTTGDDPTLVVERGALIRQNSGEDWTDVELTLSTADVESGTRSSSLYEDLRTIREKRPPAPPAPVEADTAFEMAEPMMEPVMVEEQSTLDYQSQGLATLYRFPIPVSLRSNAEEVTRLSQSEIQFVPQIYALSASVYNEPAYVMAEFKNTSAEPMLAADTRQFLDGVLIGRDSIDYVPVGGTATVGFGPVWGLSVERNVEGRSTGETGLISVANQSRESVRIEVNNLTGRDWPVRVKDRVPVSEQDDLQITYTADPPATSENVDNKRGVLEWRFDLPAGQTKSITLDTSMNWPEGMELE
jgi:uncharacterized protein (TIGR02231 family)